MYKSKPVVFFHDMSQVNPGPHFISDDLKRSVFAQHFLILGKPEWWRHELTDPVSSTIRNLMRKDPTTPASVMLHHSSCLKYLPKGTIIYRCLETKALKSRSVSRIAAMTPRRPCSNLYTVANKSSNKRRGEQRGAHGHLEGQDPAGIQQLNLWSIGIPNK